MISGISDKSGVAPPFFQEGLEHLKSTRYSEAIRCFDKAIETNPNLPLAWSEKGFALNKLGSYQQAIKCFDRAIDIDPTITDAWDNKAQALKEVGNYYEAIRCFDSSIQIDPKNAFAYWGKANALRLLRKYNEALECYGKAIEIDSKNALPLNDKGTALLELKEYNEAIKCFDKAIEIENRIEKKPIYLCNKGLALCRLQKNNEALECYGKAIEINPNLADAWKDVGLVLKELSKYREAIKCFDKAIEINPNLADAWLAKGLVLKDLEEHIEAIRCFDKAIEGYDKNLKKGSNDIIDWYSKGHALTQLGKYSEAIKCFDKAIEINPNLADAWLAKGLVLTQLEKNDEAIEQFNKSIEINPKSIEAWNQKGKVLYLLERYEEAIKCQDMVLKVKEYGDAYFFRGQAKCALKDYNSALEDFNKVNDQSPYLGEKDTSIGHCYYELGFFEDAENHYMDAIKSNPKLVRAYFHLAVLYANENKYERAKKQLETCLKINRDFSEARDAIKKLKDTGEPDWYRWWFHDGHSQRNINKNTGKDKKKNKRLDFKSILGMIVMAFIAGLIIITIILAFSNPSTLAPSVAAALTFPMVSLFGVLLLPSLKRFKATNIEIEPSPFVVTIEMLRSLYVMEKCHSEMLFSQPGKRKSHSDLVLKIWKNHS